MNTCDILHFFQNFVPRNLEVRKTGSRLVLKLGAVLGLCCSFAFFLGSTHVASAQTAGEIIWSVDLAYTPATAAPRVASSGTIYIHSDDLYAILPAGQVLGAKPLPIRRRSTSVQMEPSTPARVAQFSPTRRLANCFGASPSRPAARD